MAHADPDQGTTQGAWNALVRRARIDTRQKLAALLVSSYANADGTEVRCGVARLAVDMDCSYRTARRYLAWLRKVGLLEVTQVGNRRRGRSDIYRLILGPDILEHLDVPDPDEYAVLMKEVHAANQGTPKTTSDRRPSRDTQSVPQTIDQGTNEGRSGDTHDVPPPTTNTYPLSPTSPPDDENLRTAAHPPREPEEPPEPEIAPVLEIRPGASQEAPYVAPPKPKSFAQQNLAAASARRRAAVAAHRKAQGAT